MMQDSQLIQIVDAALADATRRAGAHLVCRPGCTPCCHGAFAISLLDAQRLRTGLAELAGIAPTQAAAIVARAEAYLAEFGPGFPGDPLTGTLGTSDAEQAAFEDFANEAPCPALHPESGLCELYSARPMTCRVFGPPVRVANSESGSGLQTDPAQTEESFAVCELCFTTATAEEISAAEMTVPHAEERAVSEAMHLPTGETIIAFCLAPRPSPPALLETS